MKKIKDTKSEYRAKFTQTETALDAMYDYLIDRYNQAVDDNDQTIMTACDDLLDEVRSSYDYLISTQIGYLVKTKEVVAAMKIITNETEKLNKVLEAEGLASKEDIEKIKGMIGNIEIALAEIGKELEEKK
jgi:flagellin-specific chaperone FliS